MSPKWVSLAACRKFVCSIEDDHPAEIRGKDTSEDDDERHQESNGKDIVDDIHEKYKPFARNDAYGVCGWHGPPLTFTEYLRVARRAVAVALVVAVFATALLLSTATLGKRRSNQFMKWFIPHCQRAASYAAGFQAVRVVGYKARDSDGVERIVTKPEAPVLVCNHVSYLDVPILATAFYPSFIAKESVKRLAIWGRIADVMGCIYVSRGSDDTNTTRDGSSSSSSSKQESPSSHMAEIVSRIRLVAKQAGAESKTNAGDSQSSPVLAPIAIFSEGTTTNGAYLLPFRTGAFCAGVPVQPVLLTYHWTRFNPAWESIGVFRHITRLLAQPPGCIGCTITLLPPVDPPVQLVQALMKNERGRYYSDDGDTIISTNNDNNKVMIREAARQFANQTRTVMAQAGDGLELVELTYQDKQDYHAALRRQGYR